MREKNERIKSFDNHGIAFVSGTVEIICEFF
jgi:hypothetical protein